MSRGQTVATVATVCRKRPRLSVYPATVQPRRHHRQAVTPEANAATIDRAGSVRPVSGSTVATVRRLSAGKPSATIGSGDRSTVPPDSGKPSRRKRPACQRFRPMSADLVRRVRNRWPSALLSPQRFDSRPPISRRKRPCKPWRPCAASRFRPVSGSTAPPDSGDRATVATVCRLSAGKPSRRKRATVRPCRKCAARFRQPSAPSAFDLSQAAPASGLSVYPATVRRLSVYPASRPPFDRGDRVPPDSGDRAPRPLPIRPPVPRRFRQAVRYHRQAAPPVYPATVRPWRPCAACQRASRHAGSERRHHRKRRPFDRAGNVPPDSGNRSTVANIERGQPFDRAANVSGQGFRRPCAAGSVRPVSGSPPCK